MKRWKTIALSIAISSMVVDHCHAQQQAQSPAEQALSAEVGAQLGAKLQCSAALIADKQALAAAQARIKELEEKYEAKK